MRQVDAVEGPNLAGNCQPIQSLLAGDCFRGESTLLYSVEPSGTAGYGPVCPVVWVSNDPRYPIVQPWLNEAAARQLFKMFSVVGLGVALVVCLDAY